MPTTCSHRSGPQPSSRQPVMQLSVSVERLRVALLNRGKASPPWWSKDPDPLPPPQRHVEEQQPPWWSADLHSLPVPHAALLPSETIAPLKWVLSTVPEDVPAAVPTSAAFEPAATTASTELALKSSHTQRSQGALLLKAWLIPQSQQRETPALAYWHAPNLDDEMNNVGQ